MKPAEWTELVELLARLFPHAKVQETFSVKTITAEWCKQLARPPALELRWLLEGARMCADRKPFPPAASELKAAANEAKAASTRPPSAPKRDWIAEWTAFTEALKATPGERRRRARLATPIVLAALARKEITEGEVDRLFGELVELEPERLLEERERLRTDARVSRFVRDVLEVRRA